MAGSSSGVFQEIYKYLKGSAESAETPMKSFGIAIIVYFIKKFFTVKFYTCPRRLHRLYGYLFIFGPAVILLCISLLCSKSFWHLAFRVRCHITRIGKSRKMGYLAILSPVIWLILAFADAQYYVCARVGPVDMLKAEAANSTCTDALKALASQISDAHAESQIIAWALIISLLLLATMMLTIARCISRQESRILSTEEFEDLEANHAVEMFNEKIKPLAESQAKNKIDNLLELLKEETEPHNLIKLAEKKIAAMYPKIVAEGAQKGRPLKLEVEKFKKDDKGNEEELVELTEKS